MRPETEAAIAAVREGLVLATARMGHPDVRAKEGRDVVTAADEAVEDLLRARLLAAFSYPVIGEERGGEAPADGSPYWLVDPICGTRNYASGTNLYCVNVALVEGGRVSVAVVGDPSRHEVLYGERGGGAWAIRDDVHARLQVSNESRMIVVEDGKSTGQSREDAALFVAAMLRADRWDFRPLGTTLAMAYLASGRIAAYVVFHVSAVHSAAGSLLVSEAGGTLSDVHGREWSLGSDTVLFSASGVLRSHLLALADAARR